MKPIVLLFCLFMVNFASIAQKTLAIDNAFGEKFRKNEKSTETIISGDALKGTGLSVYRSLIITDDPSVTDETEQLVNQDGAMAVSREIKYVDGKIYYAQLILSPRNNENRYIFYLNNHLKGGNSVMLVYMSGKATQEQIKQLLKQKN